MTRGLSACNICTRLYSVLDRSGRCKECAQRHHGLTGEAPTHPDLVRIMQQAGYGLTAFQRRIIKCVSCGESKAAPDFPPQGQVPVHRKKWCTACMEAFYGRRDHKKKPGPPARYRSPEGRACCGCQVFKPWDEFGVSKNGTNGRSSRCKPCDALRFREMRAANAGT